MFKKRLLLAACLSFLLGSGITNTSYAAYNANSSGVIQGVWIYNDGMIAVQLSPMPATGCGTNDFFWIPVPPNAGMSDQAYKTMYARALTAYANKETINIGFDNAGGGCFNTRPFIYRIGN